MHPSEEMPLLRLNTIALMAATIYAADRIAAETHNASVTTDFDDRHDGPTFRECAEDASRLYAAVEAHEYPDVISAAPPENEP